LILVHSYSRFFREAFEQEFYLRKLGKHGVKVVSITQPVGDESEPVQAMMRKVIALFDEYQSKENAKHVIRSMKENARQGFWNGANRPHPGPEGTFKGTVIVATGRVALRPLLVNVKIRFPRGRRGSLITVCSDVRVLPARTDVSWSNE
jgi:hypothetical protein